MNKCVLLDPLAVPMAQVLTVESTKLQAVGEEHLEKTRSRVHITLTLGPIRSMPVMLDDQLASCFELHLHRQGSKLSCIQRPFSLSPACSPPFTILERLCSACGSAEQNMLTMSSLLRICFHDMMSSIQGYKIA